MATERGGGSLGFDAGAVTSGGGGSVSSITLNTAGVLYVSPINFVNSSGAWSGTESLITQTANTVLAGPPTGAAAAPTMRALVAADIPTIAESQVTNLTADLASKATDTAVVHIAGTETITGIKTFAYQVSSSGLQAGYLAYDRTGNANGFLAVYRTGSVNALYDGTLNADMIRWASTGAITIATTSTQLVGFYGTTPVVQQAGGAATAAATYAANEQGMLQKVYNCLRSVGLLS